jgi:cytochrome c553
MSVHAQDAAGRNLAASCAICHGTDGRVVSGDIKPLAGAPRERIASELRAFRDGRQPATVMHQLAKGYTDREIDAMADWFAAQKP